MTASLGARASTACAVLADGTLRCWGDGAWGQLGNGLAQHSTTPVRAAVCGP